ncbi:hypothetical protein COCSADRAFT_35326 [Bipolaris sorokiniana ND90Pr]|uniref:Uncharacterized protein n=1 Tax=Cochliobolus sativus (strain ND90Pr / ATCC 201652) TaxID=665912 RepID=M2SI13_COCSN|nr:uncharacterized protein COCSADRAFT_35326 [Bipolaris sorokiniana ND90Pr]EMD66853.1 hypothetical protein COCSADRAFT_35326 [Bipolaris sorokiniana ND90Pr]
MCVYASVPACVCVACVRVCVWRVCGGVANRHWGRSTVSRCVKVYPDRDAARIVEYLLLDGDRKCALYRILRCDT